MLSSGGEKRAAAASRESSPAAKSKQKSSGAKRDGATLAGHSGVGSGSKTAAQAGSPKHGAGEKMANSKGKQRTQSSASSPAKESPKRGGASLGNGATSPSYKPHQLHYKGYTSPGTPTPTPKNFGQQLCAPTDHSIQLLDLRLLLSAESHHSVL